VLIDYFNGKKPAGSTDFTKDAAKTQALKDRVSDSRCHVVVAAVVCLFVFARDYHLNAFTRHSLLRLLARRQSSRALIQSSRRQTTLSLISRRRTSSWA
jgi:hypothetical protein